MIDNSAPMIEIRDPTLDGEAIDLGPHTRGNVARLVLGDAAAASANAEPSQAQSNDR